MKLFFNGITPRQIFNELFKAFYMSSEKFMAKEIEEAGTKDEGFVMYYDRPFHVDNFHKNWLALDDRGIWPPNEMGLFFHVQRRTQIFNQ